MYVCVYLVSTEESIETLETGVPVGFFACHLDAGKTSKSTARETSGHSLS